MGCLYAQFRCSAHEELLYPQDNLLPSRCPSPCTRLPSCRFFPRPGEGRMAIPVAGAASPCPSIWLLSLPTELPSPSAAVFTVPFCCLGPSALSGSCHPACPWGWCCSARPWQRGQGLGVWVGVFFTKSMQNEHCQLLCATVSSCRGEPVCSSNSYFEASVPRSVRTVKEKTEGWLCTATRSLKKHREIAENANSWAVNDWHLEKKEKFQPKKKGIPGVGIF